MVFDFENTSKFRIFRNISLNLSILILLFFLYSSNLYALDVIKIGKPQSVKDLRDVYSNELLRTVLDKTVEKYGAYEIRYVMPMMRDRALAELLQGKILNVYVAATQPLWEKKAIPVYFPLRKGILGYRLFLITKKNSEKFSLLESVEELKSLKAGLVFQWSIVKALKPHGFNIVYGNTL